jgi:REP element-mobilizing transposase RayT
MAQSHSSILVHVIFSTKARAPVLAPAVRDELFKYLAGVAKGEGATAHAIGGVEDHVHLLVTLPRTKTLAALVESFKSSSSRWLKTKGEALRFFAWQNGYGAFSVSHSNASAVCAYIRNQEAHHRQVKFQDEVRLFLNRHAINFDERYLWG